MYRRIKDATIISLLTLSSIAVLSYVSVLHRVKPETKIETETQTEPLKKKKVRSQDLDWLALNIYHEARGESIRGMYAVGIVTMNRVKDDDYPKTIKGVITQRNQFSWLWDGYSDKARDVQSYKIARNIARNILENDTKDVTYVSVKRKLKGSIYYHANYVQPSWSRKKTFVTKIDRHLFYI